MANMRCSTISFRLTHKLFCLQFHILKHIPSFSALPDHLRNHMAQGEEVDEETVEVRSLPLQLTRLLQPIVVPVPDSLRVRLGPVYLRFCLHDLVSPLTS